MPPNHEEGDFDLDAYLRGFLGSVVRFGAGAIHGQSANNRQYAGWGVKHVDQTLPVSLDVPNIRGRDHI